MKLVDYIASPGSKLGGGMKSGAGDDRYVFDEAAGWACVIDGATDVGPVRIFAQGRDGRGAVRRTVRVGAAGCAGECE